MTTTLNLATRASTATNFQSNLSNTNEEISISICNRLASFIFENYPNKYDSESLNRLNQRSINQRDLEFAISIINDNTIVRIESPDSRITDILTPNELTALKTSDISGQRFRLLHDEYSALMRYNEQFNTVTNNQLELPRRTLRDRIINIPEVQVCLIVIPTLCAGAGLYLFLRTPSSVHYEIY